MKLLSLTLICSLMSTLAHSQVTPPCGFIYGNVGDADSIQEAMLNGSVTDVQLAIDTAKEHRGTLLGCFQNAITYTPFVNTTPLLSDIVNIWTNNHAPAIDAYVLGCPDPGRATATAALGGYYAMLAGYYGNLPPLGCISKMMEAQQYSDKYAPTPLVANPGMFSYISVPTTHPCYLGGAIAAVVDSACGSIPSYCVTYDAGIFDTVKFMVIDQDLGPLYGNGGGAFDQGWATILMIESAIQQSDTTLKNLFKSSAILSGDWSVSEYPVYNHNYTSKLIWLLSELYLWTNDIAYKNNLNDKLDKNLIPGVMMDFDLNDTIDGTSVRFDSLPNVAQTPGRMWDGHNSQAQYHSMNTYAMVEAYVAFRDRGDLTRAAELKTYALAMLDNLANEVNTYGVPSIGNSQVAYALLIGIWKIAMYESESHPDWEDAAWILWNSGAMNSAGANTVNVGLYLLVASGTTYVPLFDREQYYAVSTPEVTEGNDSYTIYPNPAKDFVTVKFNFNKVPTIAYRIYDLRGKVITEKLLPNHDNTITIPIKGLKKGMYLVDFYTDHFLERGKIVVD
jgi:Secretion system C-terminal sorting domain